MQYRKFGNLDLKVSAAGCGVMRQPTLNGHVIDEVETPWMLDAKPSWKIETLKDFDRYFNEQLAKLQTEKAVTRIDRLVSSLHDGYEAIKEIVNGYDKWVRYLNTADKQSEKVILSLTRSLPNTVYF